jgi:hypothetical protein
MRCPHRTVSNSPPLVSCACWVRGDGHHRVNILSAVWGVSPFSQIRTIPNINGSIPTELGDLALLESLYAPAPTLPVSDSETTSCLEHFLYPASSTAACLTRFPGLAWQGSPYDGTGGHHSYRAGPMHPTHPTVSNSSPLVSCACWGRGDCTFLVSHTWLLAVGVAFTVLVLCVALALHPTLLCGTSLTNGWRLARWQQNRKQHGTDGRHSYPAGPMRCPHRNVSNSSPLVSCACWGRGDCTFLVSHTWLLAVGVAFD